MLNKHKMCGGLRKSSYLCMLFSRISKFKVFIFIFFINKWQ